MNKQDIKALTSRVEVQSLVIQAVLRGLEEAHAGNVWAALRHQLGELGGVAPIDETANIELSVQLAALKLRN